MIALGLLGLFLDSLVRHICSIRIGVCRAYMGTLCNSAKRQSMEQKMNGKLKKAGILALMGALVLAAVGGIAYHKC